MRAFLFSMVYCVIWDMSIVGFMKIVCSSLVQDQLHVITLQTYTWPVMAMAGCPTNLDRIRQFWFFLARGPTGRWGKLFGNATFAGRNGRLTAPSNKICSGETFSVFNWFKPNLVCLLGNRVNDHQPTWQKSDNYKWPLAFKRKNDNVEMLRFFSKLHMCCIWTFPMFVKKLVKIAQILRKLWRFSVSRDVQFEYYSDRPR